MNESNSSLNKTDAMKSTHTPSCELISVLYNYTFLPRSAKVLNKDRIIRGARHYHSRSEWKIKPTTHQAHPGKHWANCSSTALRAHSRSWSTTTDLGQTVRPSLPPRMPTMGSQPCPCRRPYSDCIPVRPACRQWTPREPFPDGSERVRAGLARSRANLAR